MANAPDNALLLREIERLSEIERNGNSDARELAYKTLGILSQGSREAIVACVRRCVEMEKGATELEIRLRNAAPQERHDAVVMRLMRTAADSSAAARVREEKMRGSIFKAIDDALAHNFSDAMDRGADGFLNSQRAVRRNADKAGEAIDGEKFFRVGVRGAIHRFMTELFPDWETEARKAALATGPEGRAR